MVFSSSSPIVLHREIPAFSPVGEKIVSDWRDKVMLYSLTQELQTYLTSSGRLLIYPPTHPHSLSLLCHTDQNALTHSCSIVEYTYERLLVRYHSHEVRQLLCHISILYQHEAVCVNINLWVVVYNERFFLYSNISISCGSYTLFVFRCLY